MSTAGNTTKAAAAKNTGGFLTVSSDAACFAVLLSWHLLRPAESPPLP